MIALVSFTHFLSLFAYFHVTITRASLLYHIRTWYLSRYISPTTHPNQPACTFNELPKKKRRKKKKGKQKQNKKPYNKTKSHSKNNKIIIIISIPFPKSTTTTSKQHSCVQGPLRECVWARRFWASLLLHTIVGPVCVPNVIQGLAVWRQITKKTKRGGSLFTMY